MEDQKIAGDGKVREHERDVEGGEVLVSSSDDASSLGAKGDILQLEHTDPVLNAKMHLVNNAIDEIGEKHPLNEKNETAVNQSYKTCF